MVTLVSICVYIRAACQCQTSFISCWRKKGWRQDKRYVLSQKGVIDFRAEKCFSGKPLAAVLATPECVHKSWD